MPEMLTEAEMSSIEEHMRAHAMTLAIVRTKSAPGELTHLLEAASKRLGTELRRTYSSPMSEFCFAEMGVRGRTLVILFVAGARTELVSLSKTDDASVRDIEDSIHYSNFHSEIMRHGL